VTSDLISALLEMVESRAPYGAGLSADDDGDDQAERAPDGDVSSHSPHPPDCPIRSDIGGRWPLLKGLVRNRVADREVLRLGTAAFERRTDRCRRSGYEGIEFMKPGGWPWSYALRRPRRTTADGRKPNQPTPRYDAEAMTQHGRRSADDAPASLRRYARAGSAERFPQPAQEPRSASRDTPRVSVGMPVYNAERFLEEALTSILSQSFEDFELVISDNASTDRTPHICHAFAARDERIRYVRSARNNGYVANFNNVFRLSTGEYFKWAAGDDVCGPRYLERAVEVLDGDPSVVLVWAKTVGIDEEGDRVPLQFELSDLNSPESVYSPDPAVRFRRLMDHIWWVDGPFYGVIRSAALRDTRRLHPPHMSGDQILLTELSLKGRFYEMPDELFFSRMHANKTSHRQRTLRERAATIDERTPRAGVLGWWSLLRAYPQRIVMYESFIARAPLSLRQKMSCQAAVLRAIASWSSLRARQVVAGSSPWQRRTTAS
jgi:glycosyltransferase involved in cell wall biosynthesis